MAAASTAMRPPTFWDDCVRPLLHVARPTVVALTLHTADLDAPSMSCPALRELHFPSLQRLDFRHMFFEADGGVEAFILAHAETLASLTLRTCTRLLPPGDVIEDIDGLFVVQDWGAAASQRPWAQIYGAFSKQLVGLQDLQVVELPMQGGDLYVSRYAQRSSDGVMSARNFLDEPSDQGARDDAALQEFKEVVNARKSQWLSVL